MTPSSAGLCVRSDSRSANSFGSATVIALKTVEIAITVISSARMTRHMSDFATRACAAACLKPERSSCATCAHEDDAGQRASQGPER